MGMRLIRSNSATRLQRWANSPSIVSTPENIYSAGKLDHAKGFARQRWKKDCFSLLQKADPSQCQNFDIKKAADNDLTHSRIIVSCPLPTNP